MNVTALDPGTAVVTGSTGYIGFHLCSRLLEAGWKVHAIRRQTSRVETLSPSSGLVVHTYDGSFASLDAALQSAQPDVVFHLASLFLAQHQPDDIFPLINSNIVFGTQLLEAMVARKVYRLVNTGTYWQNYENQPYSPACLYAATKQAFEAILVYYSETTPLVAATLRLFDIYGPGDTRPKLFNVLRQAMNAGRQLAMSPGGQLMDLVYIDDVVDAFLRAASYLASPFCEKIAVYAVSSGEPIPLREVVATYCRIVGRDLSILWGQRPYRTREVMIPWNNGDAVPGWVPKIGLREGIMKMEHSPQPIPLADERLPYQSGTEAASESHPKE